MNVGRTVRRLIAPATRACAPAAPTATSGRRSTPPGTSARITGWAHASGAQSDYPAPERSTMPETLLDIAERIAPEPPSRDEATRDAWIRHYAATALAASAMFRAEIRTKFRAGEPVPAPGSMPELGYLSAISTYATAAAAALAHPDDAPSLIWDLTPEAGALNGEWEEWLTEVLVRSGVNPADIDPDLDAAGVAPAPGGAR